MRILNTEELRSVYGGHKGKAHKAKHNACTTRRNKTSTRRNTSTRRKNTTRRKVARKY
jgi:hypothetical protein